MQEVELGLAKSTVDRLTAELEQFKTDSRRLASAFESLKKQHDSLKEQYELQSALFNSTAGIQSTDTRNHVGNDSLRPAPRQEVDHKTTCDLCASNIRGIRYKCLTCPDYDTCSQCINITDEKHPNHTFVKITEFQMLAHKDPALHQEHGAFCNQCRVEIGGIRYKCMHPSCPDFDLCRNCEAMPMAVHPVNHPMLKIRVPLTSTETLKTVLWSMWK